MVLVQERQQIPDLFRIRATDPHHVRFELFAADGVLQQQIQARGER